MESRVIQTLHTLVKPSTQPNELLYRYSTLNKLLRISAWYFRFWHWQRSPNTVPTGFLTTAELDFARKRWLLIAQQQDFAGELQALRAGRPVSSASRILRLRSMLGPDGLLRVGGRLHNLPGSLDHRYPPILAKTNYLSLLLMRQAHANSLHGGPLLMRSILRNYWIVYGNSLARSISRNCVTCLKNKPRMAKQSMGQLPIARVQNYRPFMISGLDYAGPFSLCAFRGRGKQSHKGYLTVFVCMASKAVHLDLVTDLSSQAFIATFKRFTARRGHCSQLYSDNATNFRGADKELRSLFHTGSKFYHDVGAELSNNGTTWSFIPPSAPHFGGLWEAAVKSAKYHLRCILGTQLFSYEELNTLICQVEACMNSRPLYPISDSDDDLTALTPGHLLIGEPLVNIIEPTLVDIPDSKSLDRWRHLTRLRDHFWKRWSTEYLQGLQQSARWNATSTNLTTGTLVIIKEDNRPPATWPLARIIAVHPGPDGLVRVATLKTAKGVVKRPIVKLCPLPVRTTEVAEAT